MPCTVCVLNVLQVRNEPHVWLTELMTRKFATLHTVLHDASDFFI